MSRAARRSDPHGVTLSGRSHERDDAHGVLLGCCTSLMGPISYTVRRQRANRTLPCSTPPRASTKTCTLCAPSGHRNVRSSAVHRATLSRPAAERAMPHRVRTHGVKRTVCRLERGDRSTGVPSRSLSRRLHSRLGSGLGHTGATWADRKPSPTNRRRSVRADTRTAARTHRRPVHSVSGIADCEAAPSQPQRRPGGAVRQTYVVSVDARIARCRARTRELAAMDTP